MQKKRRKFVTQLDYDEEERIELEDNSQFRVVSHPPKSVIDKICENIKNEDLIDLKNLDCNKLSREGKKKIEESIYAMMVEFNNMPIELYNTMPRELYEIIEKNGIIV